MSGKVYVFYVVAHSLERSSFGVFCNRFHCDLVIALKFHVQEHLMLSTNIEWFSQLPFREAITT